MAYTSTPYPRSWFYFVETIDLGDRCAKGVTVKNATADVFRVTDNKYAACSKELLIIGEGPTKDAAVDDLLSFAANQYSGLLSRLVVGSDPVVQTKVNIMRKYLTLEQ
jgi:hypothetical protein